ncbi:MAG: lyase family protein [Candidatus Berkelbacteria bacterium]
MHERYDKPEINEIFGNESLLASWWEVEKAVMRARVGLNLMPIEDFRTICRCLEENPASIAEWKDRDSKMHHDLNAFISERMRFIPENLQSWFHREMTSYDTEEAAFSEKILHSLFFYEKAIMELMEIIKVQAFKYRYTPMMADTHGQWADPQSFGKRLAGWYRELYEGLLGLRELKNKLRFSKLSGFVGNYTGITPEIEKAALQNLGFEPYYGATQIVPRTLFAPIASSIATLSKSIFNIAMSIRLGARSASTLFQEPFGKLQKGSSAGPQKRNPINCEKACGMDILISGYAGMILRCCETWEERDIAHSCVERVAWRDIFHASIHQAEVMAKVIKGLVVYPNRMVMEIAATNGCYAANVAKEQLKEWGASYGLTAENCYRIVQLAAFNLTQLQHDQCKSDSFAEADDLLFAAKLHKPDHEMTIQRVIRFGLLKHCHTLDTSEETIKDWNIKLSAIFDNEDVVSRWNEVFSLEYLLRNEDVIFEKVFDETKPGSAKIENTEKGNRNYPH